MGFLVSGRDRRNFRNILGRVGGAPGADGRGDGSTANSADRSSLGLPTKATSMIFEAFLCRMACETHPE